jgi:LacI family transcriptional regulator
MSTLTLEKVAQMAGVSRSTVSRVINGQAGVKPTVRERVWQIISETGYQPNMAARALASNRSGIIGLVIPHAASTLFADPYFPRLIQGITQACNDNDLTLTLFLFHSEDEEGNLSGRMLSTGFLDGVIIASSHFNDPLIPHLIDYEMPLVVLGRQDRYPQISFVDVDNHNGAYAATSHLLRLGYSRVAHISGPQSMVPGLDRLDGYKAALADRSRPFDPELVVEGDFTEPGGYMAMQRLLASQPDAVFAASDLLAMGAWRAVNEAGRNVPRDVALVGFDDLVPLPGGRARLTTIRQPVVRSGIEAVNVLLDIMTNGLLPPRRVILDTQLVIRESCGAASY